MAAWGPLVKKAGGWALKTAPTWAPTAKKAAEKGREHLANREKTINQATQVGGEFAEVRLRDRQFFVVRKDGSFVNSFPQPDDVDALKAAAMEVRQQSWKTPDALLRRRARERAAQLRRKRHKPRQDGEGPTDNG